MGHRGVQRRGNGLRVAGAAELAARLRERVEELQAAIATRVYAISDPREVSDPAYLDGLNAALAAAVDHRLDVLEAGEGGAVPVPPVLLTQARLDARDGISLDTVLRRYFAGNVLFGDFLANEAEQLGVPPSTVRRLLAAQATLGDRLLVAVSAEYNREAGSRPGSAAERRRETVKRLLAGELVDHSGLGYDLDAAHLALVAKGEGGEELMQELAGRLDRRLLVVRREEEPVWAGWLGGRRPPAPDEVSAVLGEGVAEGLFVAVGEPAEGLAGWRFSHLQAKAALPIAERRGQPFVRYADVALIAAIARDDLVAGSLHRLYLEPLERMRDGGKVARETLRAYFAAERNLSSTAAALGVDRRTVRNRIRVIEGLLGRPLRGSAADLEIALRLAE